MGAAASTQAAAAWPSALDCGLSRQHHEWLFRAWGLCCDDASGALRAAQLAKFLEVLESPSGFGDVLPGQELLRSVEERVLDLDLRLPISQVDADDVGKSAVLFHDVGAAVARKLEPGGEPPASSDASPDFGARLKTFYDDARRRRDAVTPEPDADPVADAPPRPRPSASAAGAAVDAPVDGVDTYSCARGCGFAGGFDACVAHEAACAFDAAAASPATRARLPFACERGCGFHGTYDAVLAHEATCFGTTDVFPSPRDAAEPAVEIAFAPEPRPGRSFKLSGPSAEARRKPEPVWPTAGAAV